MLHVPSRGVARANTMLPRLLSHWHGGGGEERQDDGYDWGSDEAAPAPRRVPRMSSVWADPFAFPGVQRQQRIPVEAQDDLAEPQPSADPGPGESVVVFYRTDDGETLQGIAQRFGIRTGRIVADNRLDPQAKLQKGMLLKLHVPHAAVSRLASERPLNDSQYAPAVKIENGAEDDEPTVAAPTPGGTPEIHIPREEIDPFSPRATPPAPRIKRLHGGRSSRRRSMADFPELFARKP